MLYRIWKLYNEKKKNFIKDAKYIGLAYEANRYFSTRNCKTWY